MKQVPRMTARSSCPLPCLMQPARQSPPCAPTRHGFSTPVRFYDPVFPGDCLHFLMKHRCKTGSGWPESQATWAAALGWNAGSYRGYRRDSHGGRAMGHRTQLALYPDLGLGFWTSETGGRWSNLVGLAQLLIEVFTVDLVLGAEPWLNASYACSLAPPVPPPNPASTASKVAVHPQPPEPCMGGRAGLEGTFGHPGYGALRVYCTAGQQLWAKYGDLELQLTDSAPLVAAQALNYTLTRRARVFDAEFQRPLLLYYGWRGGVSGCEFPAPCQAGVIFAIDDAGDASSVEIPFMEANTAPPRFDRSANVL